jgi:hypothetical protein
MDARFKISSLMKDGYDDSVKADTPLKIVAEGAIKGLLPSPDLLLHKFIRLLCACSPDDAKCAEHVEAYREALVKSNFNRFESATVLRSCILRALDYAEEESYVPVSILARMMTDCQSLVANANKSRKMSELISEAAYREIESRASENSEPNAFLLQFLRNGADEEKIAEATNNFIVRISVLTKGSHEESRKSVFNENYEDVWSLVSRRAFEDNPGAGITVWRTIVSILTNDMRTASARFHLLMFFVYLEAVLKVIVQVLPGNAPPTTTEVDDDPFSSSILSISGPADADVSAGGMEELQKLIDSELDDVQVIRIENPPEVVNDGVSPSAASANASANASAAQSAVASLETFVKMNKSRFPDGLPNALKM